MPQVIRQEAISKHDPDATAAQAATVKSLLSLSLISQAIYPSVSLVAEVILH